MLYWVQSSKLSHLLEYNLNVLLIFSCFCKNPHILYTFNVLFSITVYVIFLLGLYPK